ncbi:MAG: DUF72 domain-containing protein [Spirochaetales bacterium]|jgi:uncharacterized protein YecE (DUF72 family)|nr:DUF72 domain-containing protein [Spirochaetales bacterium]
MENLRIGTCSWKYPSWKGLVYSAEKKINFLEEYAHKYDTVEVDQWFWSLFGQDKIQLPRPETVAEYNDAVPEDFSFTIKAPNSITLTHFYRHLTGGKMVPNPYFLSIPLFEEFLNLISPLKKKIGLIMLQFEYLNRQKIDGLGDFLDRLSGFLAAIPQWVPIAVETRNPQFFGRPYFEFLAEKKLSQVFIQGYFMPDIRRLYHRSKALLQGSAVIRLHGYERDEIEKKTKKIYNSIVEPKDDELPGIISLIQDMRSRGLQVYLNVNNHYEGSAPLSIDRIQNLIDELS